MKRFDCDRFALAIQIKRKMQDLSLRELAEITGISAPTLSRYEQGYAAPDMACFVRLCDWLDLDPTDFIRERR